MNSSTVFDGKVYVFRVKGTATKNWDQPDVILILDKKFSHIIHYNPVKIYTESSRIRH